jgi:hypothetical protein
LTLPFVEAVVSFSFNTMSYFESPFHFKHDLNLSFSNT